MFKVIPMAMLATATAMVTVQAMPAHAAQIFTVNGTDYELSTITGAYNDVSSSLTSQPWFGDAQLAFDFASSGQIAFDFSSGTIPGNFPYGPFFTYGFVGGELKSHAWELGPMEVNNFRDFSLDVSETWATVTEVQTVPTPALLPGLLGMGITTLRKRKRASSGQV